MQVMLTRSVSRDASEPCSIRNWIRLGSLHLAASNSSVQPSLGSMSMRNKLLGCRSQAYISAVVSPFSASVCMGERPSSSLTFMLALYFSSCWKIVCRWPQAHDDFSFERSSQQNLLLARLALIGDGSQPNIC